MSNVVNISDGSSFDGAPVATLQGGDGGGTYDDMETRVKVLELRAEQTDKVLSRIEGKIDVVGRDLSEMKGRVNAMPSTWQLIGLVVGILGLAFVILKLTLPGA